MSLSTAALDPSVLPCAAAYVASLPAGLCSYSRHQVRTEVLAPTVGELRAQGRLPALPGLLGSLVRGEYRQPWLPDAVGCAAIMVRRDLCYRDDEAFLAGMRSTAEDSLNRPLYGALKLMLTPSVVMAGASQRWNSLRRGTGVHVQPPRRLAAQQYGATGRITFPPHLYNDLLLDVFCGWFVAALKLSRARDVELTRLQLHATSATAYLRWRVGEQKASIVERLWHG